VRAVGHPVRVDRAHLDVPPESASRLRAVALELPEAYEEEAWVGIRWRIRKRTFAHILVIDEGWPPAYARAAGEDGPAPVLTFRSEGPELEALRGMGHPFFAPVWRADEVGLVLAESTDWNDVVELVTESYRILAPKKLAALVS
jgi:YjbR